MLPRSKLQILALLSAVAVASGAQQGMPGRGGRAELEQALAQRYQLTLIGPGLFGKGGTDALQRAGGVAVMQRTGFYGALERKENPGLDIRGDTVQVFRGSKDFAFPVGQQLYVHSVYIGEDLVSLGLLTTRLISTSKGTGRLWATANFFFPKEVLANSDTKAVFTELDRWLLPAGEVPRAAAPAPSSPPPPAPPAELKPGMARDQVLAALGSPQRDVTFGRRSWLSYPGMVVLIEDGKLTSVDRSGQPPAKVRVLSEPDGADVYLDGSFVGSTPSTLELPAGTYKMSVRLGGYKNWERDVQVIGGSELTLRAHLEK